ncbi:pilus assembly PilX family protein [Rhizobacter fulvus]
MTMRPASNLHHPQRGSTLVIALILLVIVTLFGISAISSSIVNLRISRNVQLAAEAQNAAQRVIDAKISDPATFSSPASAASSVDATGAAVTYSVVFDKPTCYSLRPIPGYSYSIAAQAPKNLAWRLQATATDTNTGAKVQVRQGMQTSAPGTPDCV